MEMKIFAMRDNKAGCYMPKPFFHISKFDAMRDIRAAMLSKCILSDYPEDYDLFEVGTYDPQTGKITGKENNDFVITAYDLFLENIKTKKNTNQEDS